MNPVLLARIQFAFTIAFHFLFPPISIGLAWLLVVAEWKAWRNNDRDWQRLGRFFAKFLALTFAIGVATGIVMEFQFGTNWSEYSKFVGDIFGAPLAAEGVFAFFLESGFLGLYLFGRGKISPRWHWFSILMVAVGATISAFWIIVANSWQQTPAGFIVNEQLHRAEMVDFTKAIFNPSTVVRFTHTMMACLVCGAFYMAGIAAYLLRKNSGDAVARKALKLAISIGLPAAILVAFPTGHEHARQVARTQPEKFAAIEGLYLSADTHAPLLLFGIPQDHPPEIKAKFEISGLLSWMAFGDFNAPVMGLDKVPVDQRPPLWLTFVSFHNMVLLGSLFILIMSWAAWNWRGGTLWTSRRFLLLMIIALPLPQFAIQFGWVTAEVGRQPWIVYKLLRTADGISTTVPAGQILISLILLAMVELSLLGLYFFLMIKKVKAGPEGA